MTSLVSSGSHVPLAELQNKVLWSCAATQQTGRFRENCSCMDLVAMSTQLRLFQRGINIHSGVVLLYYVFITFMAMQTLQSKSFKGNMMQYCKYKLAQAFNDPSSVSAAGLTWSLSKEIQETEAPLRIGCQPRS